MRPLSTIWRGVSLSLLLLKSIIMNYSLTPEEIEQNKRQEQLVKNMLIKSGRTEKEAEALMDLKRMPPARYRTNPRIIYLDDIIKIPTIEDCEKAIRLFDGYNSPALICELYDLNNTPIGNVVIYAQFFCKEVFDINKKKHYSSTIGMESLAPQLKEVKDNYLKIKKLCELVGGRKFRLEGRTQVAPYDKYKTITSIYQFRML